MQALVHAHSGLRWLVLLSILIAIIFSIINLSKSEIQKKQKIVYLIALIFFSYTAFNRINTLFYFSTKVLFSSDTMSNKIVRFFTVEHTLGMIIAIALITIGYSKSKKDIKPWENCIVLFYCIIINLSIYTMAF